MSLVDPSSLVRGAGSVFLGGAYIARWFSSSVSPSPLRALRLVVFFPWRAQYPCIIPTATHASGLVISFLIVLFCKTTWCLG